MNESLCGHDVEAKIDEILERVPDIGMNTEDLGFMVVRECCVSCILDFAAIHGNGCFMCAINNYVRNKEDVTIIELDFEDHQYRYN